MNTPTHPMLDFDAIRSALVQSCRGRELSLVRGPDSDPRLIYIRSDLSTWSDESQARHVMDLTDEELSWAANGAEPGSTRDEAFMEEAQHWRHIHGFIGWLDGGGHPWDLLGHRATGFKRAVADLDLTHQRVTVGGRSCVVTAHRHALLASSPELAKAAANDPTLHMRLWRSELDHAWREAEFAEPIFFCGDRLPTIPAATPMMARKRRDGSWIFEHPLDPSWLCLMDSEGLRVLREDFPHNGRGAYAIGEVLDADEESWLD